MFTWALDPQSNSSNRVYSLHLPPLFRQENPHHFISREVNPQRPIRLRIPSRQSGQHSNQNEQELEGRNQHHNNNNRGVSVNRRGRINLSRQSRQNQNERQQQQHNRSQSIPANFRVQHHRNVIPNPRNVHFISPQNFLNLLMGIENSQLSLRMNNHMPGDIMQPGRVEQNQNSLAKQEIEMLPKTSYSGKEIQCSICLDNIVVGDEVIYLVCFHCFHDECCTKWLQKSVLCPVCKTNVREHLHPNNQQE